MARKISLVLAALLFCIQRAFSQFMDPEMLKQLVQMHAVDYQCANEFMRIINDPEEDNTFNTLFVSSGKSINDLGNYEKCQGYTKDGKKQLKYALVTVLSKSLQS